MKKHLFWIGMATILLLFVASSCRKKQHLLVSKSSIAFEYAGGSASFDIEADCSWTIEASASWFTVSQTSGSNSATITVSAPANPSSTWLSGTLTVISSNKKITQTVNVAQARDIAILINKVWFTTFYERWNTNYYNDSLPDSYRYWQYNSNPGSENWFWYFLEDAVSYQIHTKDYDTVYYPFEYTYYPDGDSIYINYVTVDETIEDYHATFKRLDNQYFILVNEYRPHQFERITSANVTGGSKSEFRINPKKVKNKPAGPLITISE